MSKHNTLLPEKPDPAEEKEATVPLVSDEVGDGLPQQEQIRSQRVRRQSPQQPKQRKHRRMRSDQEKRHAAHRSRPTRPFAGNGVEVC